MYPYGFLYGFYAGFRVKGLRVHVPNEHINFEWS